MTETGVKAARAEAKRFVEKCDALLKRESGKHMNPHTSFFGSIESGAVRRASMDLTRALAKMRGGST